MAVMGLNATSCFKRVGGEIICNFCEGKLIKYGNSSANKQRYCCKNCNKTQVENYSYNAYDQNINQSIIVLTKEGLGIRSTSRVLRISTTTLLKRIIAIAKNISQPPIKKYQEYELDEMRTFIKKKKSLIWLVYAVNKKTREIVSFNIGKRTNITLKFVIKSLELSQATKIYTDKLKNYKYLISKEFHSTKYRGTNYIERKNLTIRTHLKRFNRKTICFSRNLAILSAIAKLYFWA